MTIQAILVDARNFEQHALTIINAIKASSFTGLDVETQDSNRHDGLNQFCKYREDGTKAQTAKTVFDMRRTIMTGFSLYPESQSDVAYYINLNQKDIENRLPWEKAKLLLDALPAEAFFIAHNGTYEITAFKSCYDYPLPRIICTLQQAVSAFGPDEYDRRDFIGAGQGEIRRLIPELMRGAATYDPGSKKLPPALEELVGKVIAKESKAEHSYNGFVKSIAYSFGLKRLVKAFFGVQMTTFEEVLNGKPHMGELTGEEVVSYGADDAYWAVRLFRHLMAYMSANCPDTIPTFFSQENPMIQVYASIWTGGMKVNTKAIFTRRDEEREVMAEILRDLKPFIRQLLPFKDEPNAGLMKETWYAKSWKKYRQQVVDFANSPDSAVAFEQCAQVRGPVSNGWAGEEEKAQSKGINLSHYMPVRVLLYDLIDTKIIRSEGKTQSDGEARGKLLDRFEKGSPQVGVISALNKIAGVEQRMKLYLTPYTLLMDPETGLLYPTVSSMLASRRMAASNPNPMQLAKRGESTYVRGFFEADHLDHVIVSIDWSSIELVEIGEFSGDPEFCKAYGQIPHEDLHAGAAADILAVEVPGLDEAAFKALRNFEKREAYEEHYGILANTNRLFTDLKGQPLGGNKAYKYWRTEVGKGANFNYWYSGFLGTIGERMGWAIDKTGEATERYRNRFHVAEQWRVDLIREGQREGFITLPDGHRRTRFEATPLWANYFLDKFQVPLSNQPTDDLLRRYNALWAYIARKIQGRANNQLVNSMIQGSCATIAKRSVLRIIDAMRAKGWGDREARFMVPIHDELVFSVHRELVVEFIALARDIMIDHPDIFKLCQLDASPSVGLTFEPWDAKKAPMGQIELFEMPDIGVGRVNTRATDDETHGAVEYLFERRKLAA